MSNYMAETIDHLVAELDGVLASDDPVLAGYALLVHTTGEHTTAANVHDAWAIARTNVAPSHPDLVPFAALDADTRGLDEPFAAVIRRVAATRRG